MRLVLPPVRSFVLNGLVGSVSLLAATAYGEPAFNASGTLNLGTFWGQLDSPSGFEGRLDATVEIDELSVTAYRYGGTANITYSSPDNDAALKVSSYELYLTSGDLEFTLGNTLTPDLVPVTKISVGEGLFEGWPTLQPYDGSQGYVGAFSDGQEEHGTAVMFTTQRGDANFRIGAGQIGLAEFSASLIRSSGEYFLSASGGYGTQPASTALGAAWETGNTSLWLTTGATAAQGKRTFGVKTLSEFDTITLTTSAMRDREARVTGVKTSAAVLLDVFVGRTGILSLGLGRQSPASASHTSRSHLSYSHQEEDFGEFIISLGNYRGEQLFEAGLRLTF